MPKSYSADLRKRVIEAVEAEPRGGRQRKVSVLMRVRRCDGCGAGTRPGVARRNRAEEAFLRWNGMRNRYWLSLPNNRT